MPEDLVPSKSILGSAALTSEGQSGYNPTTERMNFHDGVQQRSLNSVGFQPYAYAIGGAPNLVTTTALALAANGGAAAWPFMLTAHMILNGLQFWNTDATLARGPAEFAVYEDRLNNSNALNLVAGAAGSLAGWTSTAASVRLIGVPTFPVYLPPGVYWVVIKNNHATATLGLGTAAGGTGAMSTGRSKPLGAAALGSTLDFVAPTWTVLSSIPGMRLQGRVFGQASGF